MSKVIGSKGPYRIAVASGKGGTGKTTLSVALALSAKGAVNLLDCDVEEPNAALFLQSLAKKASEVVQSVTVPIPVVEEEKCTGCGACAKICQYNAIIILKKKATIFSDLCHSCGACALVCPVKAIHEEPKEIGKLTEWRNGKLRFIQGELDVGNAMSPPLIRAVKAQAARYEADPDDGAVLTIIDCPPGTSCPMVTSVRNTDFALLVTEPTPFGLHDLRLAVATLRNVGIPFGVAINRCDVGDDRVTQYCHSEGIPILAQIPNDRRVAEAYSSGGTLNSVGEKYKKRMDELLSEIMKTIGKSNGA